MKMYKLLLVVIVSFFISAAAQADTEVTSIFVDPGTINPFKNETIQLYNGTPEKWTKRIPIKFPVSIYDAAAPGTCGDIIGVCDFGVLSVDVYE